MRPTWIELDAMSVTLRSYGRACEGSDAGGQVSNTMTIDVAAERAATPGARTGHHFNAAGCALPAADTLAASVEHLRLESMTGGYEAAAQVRPRLDAIYELAADLIGAEPG